MDATTGNTLVDLLILIALVLGVIVLARMVIGR
jgi:hypothetical protein